MTSLRAAESGTAEARLREVLKEVHSLLESYAPTWYTEALSKKIEAALKE
ncbi:MAG TPA: hypothetical protein VF786_01655 [Terriglobales bacterium]